MCMTPGSLMLCSATSPAHTCHLHQAGVTALTGHAMLSSRLCTAAMANKGQMHQSGTCMGLSTHVSPSTHACLPTAHPGAHPQLAPPQSTGTCPPAAGKDPREPNGHFPSQAVLAGHREWTRCSTPELAQGSLFRWAQLYLQSVTGGPGPVTKGWGGEGLPAVGSCHQQVPLYGGEWDQLPRRGLRGRHGEKVPRATNVGPGSGQAALVPGSPRLPNGAAGAACPVPHRGLAEEAARRFPM